ncbi:hypothetical protein [Magnetospirillum sp. UT-4]|uniref:hypothetical protein n=1 Tax=Magnetospirillum sp. UT-4 TaxID=2681467 RepID=UPI0013823D98|nr:hypothetical protein [Magnetospirillum sp. UT-4]CAA7621155.1 hypothetical protein MTBUT4_380026 [Magnetospirillum sp. UT-4]
MTDIAKGMKTAVATVADPAAPPVEAPQQALLPLLPADQVAELPEGTAERRAAIANAPRGRGRPPGAINKTTAAWRDYLLSRYRSPLEALAETYSRPVEDLAQQLQCKPVEAFKIQVQAAAELAPYLHGKMPVEVNLQGSAPILQIVAPEAAMAFYQVQGGGAGPLLDMPVGEVVDGTTARASEGDDDASGQQ